MEKSSIEKQIRDQKLRIIDALTEERPKFHREFAAKAQQRANCTTRILCFSIPSNNPEHDILRWSQYTNCHYGARIWIDMNLQSPPLSIPLKVEYSDELVTIDNSEAGDQKYLDQKLRKSMVTKSKCWSYEGEVRSFIPVGHFQTKEANGSTLEFVGINLKGILRMDFGMRFPETEMETIISTFKSSLADSVEFHRTECSYDEFKIEYRKIDVA